MHFVVVLNSTCKGSKRGSTPNLTVEEKSIVCCKSLKFSEQIFKRIFGGQNLKGGISNFVNYGPLGYISSCCQHFLLDFLNFFKSSPQHTARLENLAGAPRS